VPALPNRAVVDQGGTAGPASASASGLGRLRPAHVGPQPRDPPDLHGSSGTQTGYTRRATPARLCRQQPDALEPEVRIRLDGLFPRGLPPLDPRVKGARPPPMFTPLLPARYTPSLEGPR
jgi:hypothetical protein